MLTDAVKVRENSDIQGLGLVANRSISAGEIIFQFDDTKPPVHLHELAHWSQEERNRFMTFAIQLGKDEWCFRQGKIRFMNHSCDPNAWWEGYGKLVARRVIEPGEEITFDYSTSEITLTYRMECRCGSVSCRGIVTNKDYLNPDFQQKYANHLPQHVLDAIKHADSKESATESAQGNQLPEDVIEAIKQAKLKEAEFREKYGDQYVFEMVRQLILKN